MKLLRFNTMSHQLVSSVVLSVVGVAVCVTLGYGLNSAFGLDQFLAGIGLPNSATVLWPFRLTPWIFCACFYSVLTFVVVRLWRTRRGSDEGVRVRRPD